VGITIEELRREALEWMVDASFLAHLGTEDRDVVLRHASWKDFARGKFLLDKGRRGDGVYLIAAGDALVVEDQNGTEHVVARVGSGHLVGERGVVKDLPAGASVKAISPLRALFIPASDFQDMLRKSESLREHIEGLVALRERSQLMLSLLLRDPLLRSLGRDDLERLMQSGVLERYEAGQCVVRAGSTGAADVFMVVRGEVAVYAPAAEGIQRERLTSNGPGWFFGHAALLLELPRTADVEATRPSELLRIGELAFMRVLTRNPSFSRRMYQSLARVKLPTEGVLEQRADPMTVALWSRERGLGVTTLGYALAGAFRGEGKVTLVDLEGPETASKLGLCTRNSKIGGVHVIRVTDSLDRWGLEVLWPSSPDKIGKVLEKLRAKAAPDERIVVPLQPSPVPDPGVVKHVQTLVQLRTATEAWEPPPHLGETCRIDAVRIEPGTDMPLATTRNAVRLPADRESGLRFWQRGDLEALLETTRPTGRSAHRMARVLCGRTVGVALGGGGALGFAHIGLLRALDEARIPIDYIAGVGLGSLVAGVYATGGLPLLDDVLTRGRLLRRLTTVGIFHQGPLTRWVKRLTGGSRLETTEIPFFPVSADVLTGREFIPASGSVASALRSSWSMPGITPALRRGMSRLVDGGIVNSVPASVVWDAGANFIVASNVIPRTPLGSSDRDRGGLLGRADDALRSVFVMMSQIGRDRASVADYVFELSVEQFGFKDYARAAEIYELGLAQARAEMAAVLHRRSHDPTVRPGQRGGVR
jgi:NTE family protein